MNTWNLEFIHECCVHFKWIENFFKTDSLPTILVKAVVLQCIDCVDASLCDTVQHSPHQVSTNAFTKLHSVALCSASNANSTVLQFTTIYKAEHTSSLCPHLDMIHICGLTSQTEAKVTIESLVECEKSVLCFNLSFGKRTKKWTFTMKCSINTSKQWHKPKLQ